MPTVAASPPSPRAVPAARTPPRWPAGRCATAARPGPAPARRTPRCLRRRPSGRRRTRRTRAAPAGRVVPTSGDPVEEWTKTSPYGRVVGRDVADVLFTEAVDELVHDVDVVRPAPRAG